MGAIFLSGAAKRSYTWRVLVAGVLLSVFPQNQATYAETPALASIEAYIGREVRAIEWRGLVRSQAAALEQRLKNQALVDKQTLIQVGTPLELEQVQGITRALWATRAFSDVQIWAEPEGAGARLIYSVREKPLVGDIQWVGLTKVKPADALKQIDLRVGFPVDEDNLLEDVKKLAALYEEKGYPFVDIDPEVLPVSADVVTVHFVVREHPKAVVRTIRIVGNHAVAEKDIRTAMALQEGTVKAWWSSVGGLYQNQTDGRSLQSSWSQAFQAAKWVGKYRKEVLAQDVQRIRALYSDRGYLDVQVEEPHLQFSDDEKRLDITIRIEEGTPYRIASVVLEADESTDSHTQAVTTPDILKKLLPLRVGDVYQQAHIAQQKRLAQLYYQDKGYARVTVEDRSQLSVITHEVAVVLRVHLGPPIYVGRIQIVGNHKTRDRVPRRAFALLEGHLFNRTQLDLALASIKQLGFFESVGFETSTMDKVDAKATPEERVRIIVIVKERSTLQAQGSVGYSTIEGWNGTLQVGDLNFLGTGISLLANGSFSKLRGTASVDVLDPRFLDSRWIVGGSAAYTYSNYPYFFRHAAGGSLTVGYQLPHQFQFRATYSPEWVRVLPNVGDSQPGLLPALQSLPNFYRDFWRSSVRLLLSYDSRDDRIYPVRGMYHTLGFEVVDKYLGATTNFIKVDAVARFYRPIWGPVWFRAQGGVGLTWSRDPEGVPVSERTYLGATVGTRGYSWFQVGPRIGVAPGIDPNAPTALIPIGGNLALWASAEAEFPLIPPRWDFLKLRGVVFAEFGNAYNLEPRYCEQNRLANVPEVFSPCAKPSFANQRYTFGFGFRWYSPIGKFNLDWGIPLNRQPGESPVVFGLGLGASF